MNDRIRKHYNVLTNQERLSLMLEAMENFSENEGEIDALWKTIPSKNYQLSCPTFREEYQGMLFVVMSFVDHAKDCLIDYMTLSLGLKILPDPLFPDSKAPDFKKKLAQWEDENRKISKILTMMEERQSEAKAIWNAFQMVCQERGFDPEKVLVATHHPLNLLRECLLTGDSEPYPEVESKFLASYRKIWSTFPQKEAV